MHTARIPSFFEPVDDRQRDALLKAYIEYLGQRNGPIDPANSQLPKREADLAAMNASDVRYAGEISQTNFDQLYRNFSGSSPLLNSVLLLILLFSKMNAGEAYGVRVVKRVHSKRQLRNKDDLATQAILFAQEEEEYHTRILVGAAGHFNLRVEGAYLPSPALKVLIGALAYAPKPFFHPILYGAEVAGTYVFNWTLNHIRTLIPAQPELADALEKRLVEVLVDEVGHVSLNRLVLGERGRKAGEMLAAQTVRGLPMITPELIPAGFDDHVQRDFTRFDFRDLPEEVRRRGFFA
jgi:hypothetical protein